MPLPTSYIDNAGSIERILDAILDAQPPERFSSKFLDNLGFAAIGDRPFIAVLKELGFLNADGVPQGRYFQFLDRTRSKQVLADAIRDAYRELFAVNRDAHEFTAEQVANKLRTLNAGKKSHRTIVRIARTFRSLCEYADFSVGTTNTRAALAVPATDSENLTRSDPVQVLRAYKGPAAAPMSSLQYHINVVLPDTRDQAVYDAIFRSFRDHLG